MKGGQKTVGVLYREGFSLLKARYKALLLVVLVIYAVSALVGALLSSVAAPAQFAVMLPMQMMGGVMNAALEDDFGNAPWYDDDFRYHRGGPDIGEIAGVAGYLTALLLFLAFLMAIVLVSAVFSATLALVQSILVGSAEVGAKRASLQLAEGGNASFDEAFRNFGANWKRYVGVTAWVTLWTSLWSLLFVVPGIVKGYSYRLAPYLVIQYPELTARQAVRKSIEITRGYRGRLFALDLILLAFSAGAVLLGCFFLFVPAVAASLLWVMPLSYCLFAVAYLDIRRAAVDNGLLPGACAPVAGTEPAGGEGMPAALPAVQTEEGGPFTGLEEDSPPL